MTAGPGAASGHVQPFVLRPDRTSGHIWRHPATLRECLLSSRSHVRVAVGAQVVQVNPISEIIIDTTIYCSQAITQSDAQPCGWAGGYALTRQNCDPDMCRRGGPPPGGQTGSQRHSLRLMHRGCFPRPACDRHRTCTDNARVTAALAADAAFSQVLGVVPGQARLRAACPSAGRPCRTSPQAPGSRPHRQTALFAAARRNGLRSSTELGKERSRARGAFPSWSRPSRDRFCKAAICYRPVA